MLDWRSWTCVFGHVEAGYKTAKRPAIGRAFNMLLKPALMAELPATTTSPDCS